MGVMDWFRGGVDNGDGGVKTVDLDDIIGNYELIDVNTDDKYMLVAQRGGVELREKPYVTELGGGSSDYVKTFQEEYNYKLRGRLGIKKYMEMKNDARIRSSLRLAKTPVLAARWFVEAASDSEQDRYIANFIWKNLDEWMNQSWYQFLYEVLYFLDYGFYTFEKVFEERVIDGERRIVWKKLAPRHPVEVLEILYDLKGGPKSMRLVNNRRKTGEVNVSIDKLLVFTYDQEAGNLEGKSVLRSAYKHWFYKENLYKIDAIQKERHGIGIPVIILPANYTTDDKGVAERLGRNLRANEEAHVVLPPGWELAFAKLEGQKVDVLESASYHADMLYDNVMANFVISRTADETMIMENTFMKASRYIGEVIRGAFNKYAIPQLVDYNWSVDNYPQLKVRRLGETTDWRTMSFAIRNFVGAGVIIADDNLESWVRSELDMPRADEETARILEGKTGGTPQRPHIGPPRQSTAAGQNTGSNTNKGEDRSGG